MSLFHKICEKGLCGSVKMVRVKWKKKTLSAQKRPNRVKVEAIEKILAKNYETIIIFENHFGFYNIMLQRPQHLTRALCNERTLVLYNSFYDVDFKNNMRIEKLDDSFYVLDLYYYRNIIFRYLKKSKMKKFVMVYSTDTVRMKMIEEYQKNRFDIIYEYVDDINTDLISRKKVAEVQERHRRLILDGKSYVVATAEKLYQNVLKINKNANVALISNGADCSSFKPEIYTNDKNYLNWLQKDKIKVGYYGALASWVDYELLKKIAQNSDFQIILIGVEHDDSLEKSGLLSYGNVRYFGKIDYQLLAGYANYFDICTIPFVLNEVTQATSPVKLFEYMSMEKPVVTTALPECMKYDVVKVARDSEQFVEYLYEMNCQKEDSDLKCRLRECAIQNSWKAKAEELKQFIERGKEVER